MPEDFFHFQSIEPTVGAQRSFFMIKCFSTFL